MITFDTALPADSLEFCPTPGFQDLFVCGTYKLLDEKEEASPQTRRGQCLLFQMQDPPVFKHVQSLDLAAIPDMKWSHRSSGPPLLAIADSEGSVTLCQQGEQSFSQVDSIRCAPSDVICLSLDWSNKRWSGSETGSVVVSLSNGQLCLVTPCNDSTFSVQEAWHAHDYEPWAVAWNNWDPNVIYSGGDDLKLKTWDLRQGFAEPAHVNRSFKAGVTTIQSNPFVEHLIAVGSYDNEIRLFDSRKPLTPIEIADIGGGAWRVKWHPSAARKQDVLVACMHDGFKVVRFGIHNDGDVLGKSQILKENKSHDSLAYGADWSYAPPLPNGETLVGSCSFYDHKLSIWSA